MTGWRGGLRAEGLCPGFMCRPFAPGTLAREADVGRAYDWVACLLLRMEVSLQVVRG